MPSGISMRHLMFALGVLVLAAVVAIPAWLLLSSDGKADAESTFVTVSPSSDIAVLDLATGRTRLVTHADGRYLAVASPTWSPDGRRIAFAQRICAHCPFRPAVVGPNGRATRKNARRKNSESFCGVVLVARRRS